MKLCRKCATLTPLAGFHRDARTPDGRQATCRKCSSEVHRQKHQKHREAILERRRRRYHENIEASRERSRLEGIASRRRRGVARKVIYGSETERRAACRRRNAEYRLRNSDAAKASAAAWRSKSLEKIKMKSARRAAAKYGAVGECTVGQWKAILLFYGNCCALCKSTDRTSVDHFVPLSGGGSNDWRNLWPLCFACNLKKANKRLALTAPPHVQGLAALMSSDAMTEEAVAG